MELKVDHLDEQGFHYIVWPDIHVSKFAPAFVGEIEVVMHFTSGADRYDEESIVLAWLAMNK